MNKFFATILMLLSLTAFAQQPTRARGYLDYGDRFFVNQQYQQALPYFHEARRLALAAPQDVQVLLALSQRYVVCRQEALAWDCYDKGTSYAYSYVNQQPQWSRYWLNEAVKYYNDELVALMNQFGTSQPTRTAIYQRALWVQNFLAGNTPPTPRPTPTPSTGGTISCGAATNLALNRPAYQSSTSGWSKANDAQGAVDGQKNGGYGFHTNIEARPWWQVDLQQVATLCEIRVFNRLGEACRARSLQVLVSNDGQNWYAVYSPAAGSCFGGTDGKPLVIGLAGRGIAARYVRLQLNETTYFHLDEVEIYGTAR